jgi:putative oxidoreductase
MRKYILLLGRVLFSFVFLIKSVEHFTGDKIQEATTLGVPMASILVPLSGVVALLGGLSILFGYKARLGAWLLVLFLVPTTLAMHRYWEFKDIYHGMMHEYCFMKNLSMLGAALIITYFGSGPFSLSRD